MFDADCQPPQEKLVPEEEYEQFLRENPLLKRYPYHFDKNQEFVDNQSSEIKEETKEEIGKIANKLDVTTDKMENFIGMTEMRDEENFILNETET